MFISELPRVEVMGTPVTLLQSYKQATEYVVECVEKRTKISCVAINPEKIQRAHEDEKLREFVQSADLCICDGVGAAVAMRILFGLKIPRITGVQLFMYLAACAEERGLRIFLLGGTPESNDGAYEKLRSMHSQLHIAGRHHGYFTDDEAVIDEINDSQPDMLFVALGSPRQETWISRYREQLNVSFCMGVGGSFDVLSGKAHLAPQMFRKTGTEWLYRLLCQPKRIRRQIVLPVFVLGLVWHYFSAKVIPHEHTQINLTPLDENDTHEALVIH
ncbi:WecB/TagA/CpsF family glycosyltransferase [Planctomycetota bacterium]